MKSILHQLKKYQPKPEPLEIQPPHQEQAYDSVSIEELAERIVPPAALSASLFDCAQAYRQSVVAQTVKCLKGLVPHKWSDVLYPLEVLAAYHCYYIHGHQATTEQHIDNLLKAFLSAKNMVEFRIQFEQAVQNDSPVKKLILIRVALATYGEAARLDKLPVEPFRAPSENYLRTRGCGPLADLQARLHCRATIEQIILGRMGYLVVWYGWHRDQRRDLPLLKYEI